MDDFRKLMYGVLTAFVVMLVVWVSFLYISACGFTFTCRRAIPAVDATPIPTLAAATLPAPDFSIEATAQEQCRIAAVPLIGAWVSAGYPETDPFPFTDIDGQDCEGTFADDIQALFVESNLWFPGALSCTSCHNADLAVSSAQMDLTSYDGVLAGSRRTSTGAKGNDILGDGDWEASLLHDVLFVRKTEPLGRPPDLAAEGPVVFAGTTVDAGSQ
jgi:hypothetical protein